MFINTILLTIMFIVIELNMHNPNINSNINKGSCAFATKPSNNLV